MNAFPPEWLARVPARVFACLRRGELKIIIHPGAGMLDGGVFVDVQMDLVPFDLRMPNTKLWLKVDESFNVVSVWRREED
jgi:hypothetical protein